MKYKKEKKQQQQKKNCIPTKKKKIAWIQQACVFDSEYFWQDFVESIIVKFSCKVCCMLSLFKGVFF